MNAINLDGAIEIDAAKAVEIIQATDGLFFRVDFVKRTDETLRRMVARIGVAKHAAGGDRKYDPAQHNLVPVWDAEHLAYRCIPIEGIRGIRSQKVAYRVV